METIVIINKGRDAAKAGLPRVAPETIDYPIVSRYVPYHTVEANLSPHMQKLWLEGYDSI